MQLKCLTYYGCRLGYLLGYHLQFKISLMIISVQCMPQQAEPKFYSKNSVADCKTYGEFRKIKTNRFYMEINMK